jgi:uracil-DNA glycosylase family 4
MLREMGISLWLPEGEPAPAESEVVVAPALPPRAAAPSTPRTRTAEPSAAPTARLPGLAPADWLVVAEPLDDGDPQQQQLLDNMLRAIGVALVAPDRGRRAVFCALAAGRGNAATRASDQAAVQAAIATAAPRCILAFGRAAAAVLLGDDAPLGGLRGRVHAHAGVPVVVTFPLVFLLRHPAEKAKAWADLCMAVGSLAASAA